MDKAIIQFKTGDYQKIERLTPLRKFASDTINYVRAEFALGEEWEGFDRLYVAWRNDKQSEPAFTDLKDGAVMIPDKLLTPNGTIYCNLVGENYVYKDGQRYVNERAVTYPEKALTITKTSIGDNCGNSVVNSNR